MKELRSKGSMVSSISYNISICFGMVSQSSDLSFDAFIADMNSFVVENVKMVVNSYISC